MLSRIFPPECWLYSQPHSSIGDGICDDHFNSLACNYDQGDCCYGIKGLFCSSCECKDENTNHPLITSTQTPCEADESIIGDGTCDAEAATWECDEYDGGDCTGNVHIFLK